MDVFLVSRCLKDINERLIAVSVRGKSGDIYYEDFLICTSNNIKEQYNLLFEKTIKYIGDVLIKNKRYSIRYLNVIGDSFMLPYKEYFTKRSSGCFYNLSSNLKKDTNLHNNCKELYEYLKSFKGLSFNFTNWGLYKNGDMWAIHKSIKKELGELACDKYFDEDKSFENFLKYY